MLYKGLVFDFDGTITPKGIHYPTRLMVKKLIELAGEMPIACCTGRQLESFERHAMEYFLQELQGPERKKFLKNMFLMAENGSVGYFFDEKIGDFQEFYQAKWPEQFVQRDHLMKLLSEAIRDYGNIYYDAHKVVVVMRTHLHSVGPDAVDEVYKLSTKIYELTIEILKNLDSEYENYLHVGNSGIGVVVCPAEGDKDTGIRRFADLLNFKRKIEFGGSDIRDIMVVGDNPQKSGNDHYLLNGTYGTPFSVGELIEDSKFPLGVYDEDDNRLLHDEGTLYLINKKLLTSDSIVV